MSAHTEWYRIIGSETCEPDARLKMPIYEYAAKSAKKCCPKCKAGFEILQPLSEASLSACPDCGAAIAKQISAPNVGGSTSNFDDRAKSAGFSKLKRLGKGEYEKQY